MPHHVDVSRAAAGPRLLERGEELALLDGAVADVAGGRARAVLVEGPAGIGKSRLLAEVRRLAEAAGLAAVLARGGELEREFPFGVVRQLFESALAEPDALAGAAAPARAVFDLAAEPARDSSFATLHGLYWLTANLSADRPLLVVVDDLHWCDSPSLRYVAYLVRRLEGLPVLLACGLRSSAGGIDPGLVAEIAADPLTTAIRPRPLSERAVLDLVEQRLGGRADETFAAACHSSTGGNPLLLAELLRALAAEGARPDAASVEMVARVGPHAASRAVLVRLARLPAEAVRMARAAAVLGDGASFQTVASLARLDDGAAATAADALVNAEVLRPEPPVAFVHPLVRAAVYHDITPVTRAQHHERAAALLADAGAADEQVAAHLLAIPAGRRADVVATLRRAARTSLQRGAADSAVAYLTRALEERPRERTKCCWSSAARRR